MGVVVRATGPTQERKTNGHHKIPTPSRARRKPPNAKIDLWAGIRVRTPNSKAAIHLENNDTYYLTGDKTLHPAIAERLAEYGLKEKTWNQ